ncbi:MAG: penicillin-binding protein 2 [Acidobacteria bacterium]|nr:penicillin-binding protein 2 [Acidobacteriota bacterium]
MKVRESREELIVRVRFLSGVLVCFLLVVLLGFWRVQIASGEHFRGLAENNRLRRQPVESLRGLILDREGRVLVENVASYNLLLHRERSRNLPESLGFAAEVLGRHREELEDALARGRSPRGFGGLLLAENLSLAEVARFGVAGFEHPEFEIQVHHLRLYRHGPQTAHALGYLAEVTEKELARKGSDYQAGDQIGRLGVEQTFDSLLRGKDGEQVVVVDSRGRLVEEFHEVPPEEGERLELTLDLELQQEASELLREKVGSVVALDPRTGEILALVSSPSYDPNIFSRRLQEDEWRRLLEAPHDPLQNRAIQNTYSPGSLFKIVMAIGGLSEGAIAPQERIWCGGSARHYNRRFRCWKRGGHGWVNLREALKSSCDVYFYEVGQRLGIERIARYARLLGLGSKTRIDLAGESPGLVPDLEWAAKERGTSWYPGETISVAIGQGPLLATPLQMAKLMAMVANSGKEIVPHLDRGADLVAAPEPDLHPEVLARVSEALWAVVNETKGTGGQARLDGLDIAGKTGTVQVVAQNTWVDSKTLPPDQRDHAWFASFAPSQAPELVVVVFVEHGGKGSEAAAPIARALYEKYFEAKHRHHRAG